METSHDLAMAAGEGDQSALQRLHALALQDDPEALYWLGIIYFEGSVVEQSDRQSVGFFHKSAEAGHAISQFNLGCAYYHGQGIAQSDAKALKWCRLSAEAGVPDAQFWMGVSYLKGKCGLPANQHEGRLWCERAAHQGHPEAQKMLDILDGKRSAQPTPDELYDFGMDMLQSATGTTFDEAAFTLVRAAMAGSEKARRFFQQTYQTFLAASERNQPEAMAQAVMLLSPLLGKGSPNDPLVIASMPLLSVLVGGPEPKSDAIEKFKELVVEAAASGNHMAALVLQPADDQVDHDA